MKLLPAFLGFLAAVLSIAEAHAANYSVGSIFRVKVTSSSTGHPCEASCWERWQSNDGVGMLMVEKDSAGNIIAAGRITDPYFADLYLSTDEAIRKIPAEEQITRDGVVVSVGGVGSCQYNCALQVDFGNYRALQIALNSSGKLFVAKELGDNTGAPPTHVPYGPTNPGALPRCQGPVTTMCIQWDTGVGFRAPPGIGLEIQAVYIYRDEFGRIVMIEVEYSNGVVIQIY